MFKKSTLTLVAIFLGLIISGCGNETTPNTAVTEQEPTTVEPNQTHTNSSANTEQIHLDTDINMDDFAKECGFTPYYDDLEGGCRYIRKIGKQVFSVEFGNELDVTGIYVPRKDGGYFCYIALTGAEETQTVSVAYRGDEIINVPLEYAEACQYLLQWGSTAEVQTADNDPLSGHYSHLFLAFREGDLKYDERFSFSETMDINKAEQYELRE